MDIVITGASRGIGRALALALPERYRVHAVARDGAALNALVAARPGTRAYVTDIAAGSFAESSPKFSPNSSPESSPESSADPLALSLEAPAILVHNAGVWPSKRELVNGVERAWAVNVLGPLAFQRPLLPRLSRVLVVGAGLMIKGRFDARKTPRGDDFSWFRTYATTKLAFAVAMRDVARENPHLDVAIVHPGVVRTELGARGGVLGWLVDRVKRRWESPEVCAERLVRMIERERWSPPGDARWFFEGEEQPWPPIMDRSAPAVREALPPALLAPQKDVKASA